MDANTAMKTVIISTLLFWFLSSAMMVAEPNNAVLREKMSSLRQIIVQMKIQRHPDPPIVSSNRQIPPGTVSVGTNDHHLDNECHN
ncbi:hypothetical protein ACB092_12G173400 [Castanea dentata]